MRPATGLALLFCASAFVATSSRSLAVGGARGFTHESTAYRARGEASLTDLISYVASLNGPVGKASRASIISRAGGAAVSLGASPRRPIPAGAPQEYALGKEFHEFFFTRARYSSNRGRRGGFGGSRCGGASWCVDWWEADYTFSTIIDEFLDIDVYVGENSPTLDDPDLHRFPFLYALEVGGMSLRPSEVEGLRSYLLHGGFLVIDDFWDDWEWYNFQVEIAQVLPEYEIVDIPFEHPVLHAVYDVEEIIQVPNISNARRGGPTGECRYDPVCAPFVKGIFDEKGRLMVIINGNTDLGDAWEHADNPYYPTYYSTYAFFMGMNMIVYALAN